ncbi:AAA family ATPase [Microbacterium sp. SS28]|uniref:AAA family ATPase n=1 Tax=Microbacterium sp. SS28 TaxID=2919948 RepID=UPI001FAA841B|nr:AAA family ATPase [Microbacterium sp. SS28]
MKLHRLDLQCFGPFRDRQTVDFDAFDADGLFLISGRTGAGKSSILDGVCYALYGTVPRYDGGDRGLRSDHADPDEPTEVRLEFSAAGARWRVTRSPEYERPKARGEGMTVQKSSVLVEQLVGEAWIGRATKYREVAELLDGILGLNRDQFQQVILLAQNRFAEFLLAGNEDRQTLLRTLFGTRRYEEYENSFEQRKRLAQQGLEAGGAALDAQLAQAERIIADNDLTGQSASADTTLEALAVTAAAQPVSERIGAVERAIPRAGYRADESARLLVDAQTAHDVALAEFGRLTTLRRRQEERQASRAAFAALEERVPAVEVDRRTLDRARAAEAVRAPIESAARARMAATHAEEAEQSAKAAWIATGEPEAGSAELREIVDVLSGELAVWAHAAEVERSLPALDAAQAREEGVVAEIDAALLALAESAAARIARLAALEPELAAAEAAAPPQDAARASLAEALQRREAGFEAERLALLARDAEAAHHVAAGALEHASGAVRVLLQRRLDGYAGELAANLVDGDPCPVCGAAEHPHPAEPSGEPVTDDIVAAAESAVEAASLAARDASERARDARALHHDASARAGGEALAVLDARHAAAESRVAEAAAAAAVVATLKTELRQLRSDDAGATTERDDLTTRLVAGREARATTMQQAADARALVEAARADFPAVSDRIAAAQRRRTLARALADALDERARVDIAASEVGADRDARIGETSFTTADEASAALRDAATRAALGDAIRRFDADFAGERKRLFDLESELAGAPEELVDLDVAEIDATAARDRWKAAVAKATRDAEITTQLTDAASRAAEAYAATAERAAEYEVIAGLANAVAGRTDSRMDLETFVLAAELEEIVAAANLRLDTMSAGRYRLQHTDAVGARRVASGLGLEVLDAYTGQARQPRSLSGGETFLASLALALGLAEVVTAQAGGIRLDTLFIDEGFGSLDADTLELAMHTLDELRQGGRTVGVISHVDTMKERLAAQLLVERTPRGPSVIRQDAVAARPVVEASAAV